MVTRRKKIEIEISTTAGTIKVKGYPFGSLAVTPGANSKGNFLDSAEVWGITHVKLGRLVRNELFPKHIAIAMAGMLQHFDEDIPWDDLTLNNVADFAVKYKIAEVWNKVKEFCYGAGSD